MPPANPSPTLDRFLAEHPEHLAEIRYTSDGRRLIPPEVAAACLAWRFGKVEAAEKATSKKRKQPHGAAVS